MTPIETKPAQVAVISCDPDPVAVAALIGELEAQLVNRAATILAYGVSLKQQDGFIVVEVVTALPGVVVDWLKNHPRIKDYVIYDVASQHREDLATKEASPDEHELVIRYRPSARGCEATYTTVEAEAAEGLAASLHYANDPVVVALPTPAFGRIAHSFADIWLGDQMIIESGPLYIVIRLRAQEHSEEGGQSHA